MGKNAEIFIEFKSNIDSVRPQLTILIKSKPFFKMGMLTRIIRGINRYIDT